MPTGTARSSSPTTPTATATGSMMLCSRPRASRAPIASRSAWSGSKSAPTPTSRRCSTRSRSSASSTTGIAISSSRRREQGRRSSRPRTTATWSSQAGGAQPSLLFVAHRREILEQSLRTYREVLSDGDFGELYVGGQRPERWKHVFASVQSLTSYGVANIPRDAYEVVVIDEFHHAEAKTYRRILDHLQPRELLGLTATPERADGTDVRSFFDGRTAAELRLWDALGADLLCPFHYFGIADGTDLRQVTWTRGRYDEAQLADVYTGNDARARIVLTQVRDKIANVGEMRALGLLRQRRPRRVHDDASSTTQGSQHARSRAALPAKTARMRSGRCGRRTSTCSSLSTSSTKVSTSPTWTRCCFCGRPRAPRSSCSNWVAGCDGPSARLS